MIIALGCADPGVQAVVDEVLGLRHVTATIVPTNVVVHGTDRLLGKDSVAHAARQFAAVALHRMRAAQLGLGLAGGIELAPEGTFAIAAAVIRSRSGHEAVAWGRPRLIPEAAARSIHDGGTFDEVMKQYHEQWRPVDPVSIVDIEELLTRRGAYTEAISGALDALQP